MLNILKRKEKIRNIRIVNDIKDIFRHDKLWLERKKGL